MVSQPVEFYVLWASCPCCGLLAYSVGYLPDLWAFRHTLSKSQAYLRHIPGISKVYLKLSLVFLRHISDISLVSLKYISGISQTFLKYILGISQAYPRNISEIYQAYLHLQLISVNPSSNIRHISALSNI